MPRGLRAAGVRQRDPGGRVRVRRQAGAVEGVRAGCARTYMSPTWASAVCTAIAGAPPGARRSRGRRRGSGPRQRVGHPQPAPPRRAGRSRPGTRRAALQLVLLRLELLRGRPCAAAAAWSAAAWACSAAAGGGDPGDDRVGVRGELVQRRQLLDQVVGRAAGQERGEPGLGVADVAGLRDRPQLRLLGVELRPARRRRAAAAAAAACCCGGGGSACCTCSSRAVSCSPAFWTGWRASAAVPGAAAAGAGASGRSRRRRAPAGARPPARVHRRVVDRVTAPWPPSAHVAPGEGRRSVRVRTDGRDRCRQVGEGALVAPRNVPLVTAVSPGPHAPLPSDRQTAAERI